MAPSSDSNLSNGIPTLSLTAALAVAFVGLLIAYRALLFFTAYYTFDIARVA
jgi:hypothetical protein